MTFRSDGQMVSNLTGHVISCNSDSTIAFSIESYSYVIVARHHNYLFITGDNYLFGVCRLDSFVFVIYFLIDAQTRVLYDLLSELRHHDGYNEPFDP